MESASTNIRRLFNFVNMWLFCFLFAFFTTEIKFVLSLSFPPTLLMIFSVITSQGKFSRLEALNPRATTTIYHPFNRTVRPVPNLFVKRSIAVLRNEPLVAFPIYENAFDVNFASQILRHSTHSFSSSHGARSQSFQ